MAINKERIATVVLGKHALNDTYIIYSNGTYDRHFDRSLYALKQTDTGIVSAFSNIYVKKCYQNVHTSIGRHWPNCFGDIHQHRKNKV